MWTFDKFIAGPEERLLFALKWGLDHSTYDGCSFLRGSTAFQKDTVRDIEVNVLNNQNEKNVSLLTIDTAKNRNSSCKYILLFVKRNRVTQVVRGGKTPPIQALRSSLHHCS